jgi:hypothetical protein
VRGDDDTLRDRLGDWWFDVRWWFRQQRRYLHLALGRKSVIYDHASAEATERILGPLVEALRSPWPWDALAPCPLHPKNLSTPYGPRCCYNPVLQVEDLCPVMQCVTYDESAIKLAKGIESPYESAYLRRYRFFGPSSNPEMKLEPRRPRGPCCDECHAALDGRDPNDCGGCP